MPELAHFMARGSGTFTPPPSLTLEVTPEMMATLQAREAVSLPIQKCDIGGLLAEG